MLSLLIDPMLCLSCTAESISIYQEHSRDPKQKEGWFSPCPKNSHRENKAQVDIYAAFRAANAEGGPDTAKVGRAF